MFLGVYILLAFLAIVLLFRFLMQLVQWDEQLRDNRAQWLNQLAEASYRMREIRRQLEGVRLDIPGLGLSPANRRKLQLLRWVGKALTVTGRARG